MSSKILPLLPQHTTYVEPFAGGAAIFFAKPKAKINVLNDINGNIVSVYKVFSDARLAGRLIRRLEYLPYSEELHREAKEGLNDPNISLLDRAFYTYIRCNFSFAKQMFGGFGYEVNYNKKPTTNQNRTTKEQLVAWFGILKGCHVFNRDAIEVIDLYDSDSTLFYVDPPYIGCDQGHYKGYTLEHFALLLDKLGNIKGKFLLSHYADDMTREMCERFSKCSHSTLCRATGSSMGSKKETRVEGLFANYDLDLAGLLGNDTNADSIPALP